MKHARTFVCQRTWEMDWRVRRAHRCLPIKDLLTRAHSNKHFAVNTRATDQYAELQNLGYCSIKLLTGLVNERNEFQRPSPSRKHAVSATCQRLLMQGDRRAKFPVNHCGTSQDCNINWLYFNLIMNDPCETVQKLLSVQFVIQTPDY